MPDAARLPGDALQPAAGLNYQHLYYFWVIGREGSLTRAAARLRLTHSTLSAQVRKLEAFLGGELFDRRGRSLVLTPLGEDVAEFASDIFRLGVELVDATRATGKARALPFRVGAVSGLPKTLVHRLLEPALTSGAYRPLVARQDALPRLLAELASGHLHLVLSDVLPPSSNTRRIFSHVLGESDLLLYGTRRLAAKHRPAFPRSLDGAPLLVPGPASAIHRVLGRWMTERGLRPVIAGEFDDAGLMRVFGAHGLGLFPVREALRAEVEESYGVELVGRLTGARDRYFALSSERRVRHAGVTALIDNARRALDAPSLRSARERTKG